MDGETGGKRLLQLVGLVGVEDAEGVEVLAAPYFELHHILAALDLDTPGVLAPGREQKILDLINLLAHCGWRVSSGGEFGDGGQRSDGKRNRVLLSLALRLLVPRVPKCVPVCVPMTAHKVP